MKIARGIFQKIWDGIQKKSLLKIPFVRYNSNVIIKGGF